MDETSPLRAAPALSPVSPLSPLGPLPPNLAFVTAQRKKRSLSNEYLGAPKDFGQVGPAAREQRGDAREGADEGMKENDEGEREGEGGGGHRPKVARASHLDESGFGHEAPSSSEASPRRPVAKAMLRGRALNFQRLPRSPPFERTPARTPRGAHPLTKSPSQTDEDGAFF
ncbi:hypothetical protein T492DRAFT_869931 [Pavlovales sp. CCMP2436]|nr:hypothetical protein T492DRAFT_869931 [Pavlovales sp. CCMP2436]